MNGPLRAYEKRIEELVKQHDARAKKVVPELYGLLKQAGYKPNEIRTMIETDLGRIWKLDTIQRSLPSECKDEKQQQHRQKRTEKAQARRNVVGPSTTEIVVRSNGSETSEPIPHENAHPEKREYFDLIERINELEEPFDYTLKVMIAGHKVTATVHVRPALKEVSRVDFDETEIPARLFV